MKEVILHVYYDDFFREINLDEFNKNLVSMGRNEANDIVIYSPIISDRHIVFEKKDGVWLLHDQKSTNVVTFKGKEIETKRMDKGDIYSICDTRNSATKLYIVVNEKDTNFLNNKVKYDIKNVKEIRIGKKSINHIVYSNNLISGEHATIYKTKDEQYYIKDLNSKNGTFLNGKRVVNNCLYPGDVIHICGHKLIYERERLVVEDVGNGVEVNKLKKLEYPVFQRSPRLIPKMPAGEEDIPNPPNISIKPSINWLIVLIGPVAMITLSVVMAFMMNNTRYLIFTVPMTLVSLLTGFLNYNSQKKKHLRHEEERKNKYLGRLEEIRADLIEKQNMQRNAMLETHPDNIKCIEIVEKKDRRLWDRHMTDEDFLDVRLGIGKVPFNINVKVPKKEISVEEDPLKQKPQEFINEFSHVNNVPITVPLYKLSTVGIIGDRIASLETMRSMVSQIVAHHGYDEVKIVAIFPQEESEEWAWMRWLPQVWDEEYDMRFMANDKSSAHEILTGLNDILNRRKLDNGNQKFSSETKMHDTHYVFILADRRLLENESIMTHLSYNNKSLGISSIFLFGKMDYLPKDCRCIIEVKEGRGRIKKESNVDDIQFMPDRINIKQAENLARKMSPIRLKTLSSSSNIPSAISMLDLLEVKKVEELDIISRWNENKSFKTLNTPLGVRAGGEKLYLNLHDKGHGPHGLVAGTTGSGKSELLQSLIVSLGINYHPHDVAFILIDYKGGSTANIFKDLPHLVGTITNLDGKASMRALASIKAESKKRQEYFAKYGVNHIDAYQRLYTEGKADEPIPHLILIVDEFAELKTEQPDFMKELVSTARVGRSLGIHLILATQKPSGVVDEQIWSNSRFKLCLKVQSSSDSQEVIKRPDAADIKQAGRTYLQVGNDEMFELFQAAWSGAKYNPNQCKKRDLTKEILEVSLDGERKQLIYEAYKEENTDTADQLSVLIQHLNNVSHSNNIERLRGLWLPPLPEKISLQELREGSNGGWNGATWDSDDQWMNPIIGLVDDPARQNQRALRVNFAEEGHLALYGEPGSGKTTFLQTVVTSLALSYSPEDLNIYLLDFGGRTLNVFSELPHVGGVVMPDEEEKLNKLVKFILKEIDKRKKLFSDNGASNLSSYRRATGDKLPAVFIMVDNYAALNETYPDVENFFIQLSREGGNYGIYLVVTANNLSNIRFKVSSNIKSAIALQLSDNSEYNMIVGRTEGLFPSAVRGRGLVKMAQPLEFQTALAVHGDTEMDRIIALKNLIADMNKWSGVKAKPIPILPDILHFKDLQGESTQQDEFKNSLSIPVGLDAEEITPVYLDITKVNNFIVSGKMQSGKTNFLKAYTISLCKMYSPEELRIYLVDSQNMGLYSLKELPNVAGYIRNVDEFKDSFKEIDMNISERKEKLNELMSSPSYNMKSMQISSEYPRQIIIVDDYNDFKEMIINDYDTKDRIEQIIRREKNSGLHIIMGGQLSDIGRDYDPIIMALKEAQNGLLLGDVDDQQVFNSVRLPYNVGKTMKIGDSYYFERGSYIRVKTPLVQNDISI